MTVQLKQLDSHREDAPDSNKQDKTPELAVNGNGLREEVTPGNKQRNVGNDIEKKLWREKLFSGRQPGDVVPMGMSYKIAKWKRADQYNEQSPYD